MNTLELLQTIRTRLEAATPGSCNANYIVDAQSDIAKLVAIVEVYEMALKVMSKEWKYRSDTIAEEALQAANKLAGSDE